MISQSSKFNEGWDLQVLGAKELSTHFRGHCIVEVQFHGEHLFLEEG